MGFVTLRLAGTVLQDQATARAWEGDPALEVSPVEQAADAWRQPIRPLLTAGGTPSGPPTVQLDRPWLRTPGPALRLTVLAVWEPGAHFTEGAEASLAGVAAFTAEASVGAAGAIQLSVLFGGWVGAWDLAGVGIPSGTGRRSGTTHGGTAIHPATFTHIRISK